MNTGGLSGWLAALEKRAPAGHIELGLERVRGVLDQLAIDLRVPVVTVAGTNGKGSVVAMLESIWLAAGRKPFAYTSPHLIEFSERMRIAGRHADEAAIVSALERVESVRGECALTYFEHITLAALVLAAEADIDVAILEVGLGGRLDAVNVVDPDLAVITSIGLDHTEWLGTTRDQIGREKAGVARPGKPVVVGDDDPPAGLISALEDCGAQMFRAGREFSWRRQGAELTVRLPQRSLSVPDRLPAGRWQSANAACAVMAAELLKERVEVTDAAVSRGLASLRLPGRFERVGHSPEIIMDVAHNGAAAEALAALLDDVPRPAVAVFSVLEGKNVEAIGQAMDRAVGHWIVAGLAGDRGRRAGDICAELAAIPVSGSLEPVESVPAALRLALERAGRDGRIVVFGSFRTVAEAWPIVEQLQ